MTAAVIVILVNTVFDKHSLKTGLSVSISFMLHALGQIDTKLLIWCLSWEATQAKYANILIKHKQLYLVTNKYHK